MTHLFIGKRPDGDWDVNTDGRCTTIKDTYSDLEAARIVGHFLFYEMSRDFRTKLAEVMKEYSQ